MDSFWKDMPTEITNACDADTLVACKAITHNLMLSAKQTVAGSMAAAFFSLQLIFLSAKLHERARYNHVVEKMIDNDEGGFSSSPHWNDEHDRRGERSRGYVVPPKSNTRSL